MPLLGLIWVAGQGCETRFLMTPVGLLSPLPESNDGYVSINSEIQIFRETSCLAHYYFSCMMSFYSLSTHHPLHSLAHMMMCMDTAQPGLVCVLFSSSDPLVGSQCKNQWLLKKHHHSLPLLDKCQTPREGEA